MGFAGTHGLNEGRGIDLLAQDSRKSWKCGQWCPETTSQSESRSIYSTSDIYYVMDQFAEPTRCVTLTSKLFCEFSDSSKRISNLGAIVSL